MVMSGLALVVGATASSVPDLVAARQANMKLMAAAAKTISEMFAGSTSFDAALFRKSIETLEEHSGAALAAQFPNGSFEGASSAKAQTTSERSRFESIAARLHDLALVLDDKMKTASVITSDMRMGKALPIGGSLLGALPSQQHEDLRSVPAEHVFHLMLETCTSCHATYRASHK